MLTNQPEVISQDETRWGWFGGAERALEGGGALAERKPGNWPSGTARTSAPSDQPAGLRLCRDDRIARSRSIEAPRRLPRGSSLLPKRSISRTWKYSHKSYNEAVLVLTKPTPRQRQKRATQFLQIMAAEGLTRAGLARKLGVSRAWISKVLNSGNTLDA